MLNNTNLSGRTVFITGASRGIGKAIALKLAKCGANVVIAAKTTQPHPKLEGTIYTASQEVEAVGGKALPCVLDVRDESQVRTAVQEAVKRFGGIDIVVNNASAISLSPTAYTDMKRYDLMHNVNTRGTFLVTKECLPFLKKSDHAHVLNISPPLSLKPLWFKNNLAYTMAKYGMSMCVLGMHEEFRPHKIAVNALWPRTEIHTAAIDMLRGSQHANHCRKPEIMAVAAYAILASDPTTTTGNFFLDEEVLRKQGVTDFDQYCIDPAYKDQIHLDGFVDGKIVEICSAIEKQSAGQLQGAFQFVVTGNEAAKWFVDFNDGRGVCGWGKAPSSQDATITMDCDDLWDIFNGKMKFENAFKMGKISISGNIEKALELDKLGVKVKL